MKVVPYVGDFQVTLDDGKFFYVSNDGVSYYKSKEYYDSLNCEDYNDRFNYKASFTALDIELQKYAGTNENVDACIKMIAGFERRF